MRLMERPSNQVLREYSENAKRASKENQPPHPTKLGAPIIFNTRDSYKKATAQRGFTDGSTKAPAKMILSEPTSDRHVTFDDISSHTGLAAIHPAFRPRQRPPQGRVRANTPLDYKAGSMDSVECLPQRLHVSKSSPAMLQERLEELIRENGYLQQELLYHKDTLAVMNGFFETTRRAHHDLQNALAETARKVAISEQRLLDCYGVRSVKDSNEDNVF